MTLIFIINSILFGIGLSMDAFSVSLANGLKYPRMGKGRACLIAGTFCFFQFIMPLTGWVFVHTLTETFISFQPCIPWIALILLLYIGGKMLKEGIEESRDRSSVETSAGMIAEEMEKESTEALAAISITTLLLQGIATSIDALSVGFTISDYSFEKAAAEAIIIGLVTFVICIIGIDLGKKIGMKLSGKASILGGIILIAIGIEIFVST